jgi:hypothetical protein
LTKEIVMKSILTAGILALTLAAMPIAAQAGTIEGVAIGVGSGALVAGPPGALIGGVIGAVVGGPDIVQPRQRHCWTNRSGYRQCAWR